MSLLRKKDLRAESAESAFAQAARRAGLIPAEGKEAVDGRYRKLISTKNADTAFAASVDLDRSFVDAEPAAPRWDFGLGIRQRGRAEFAIWVEPHSAGSTSETKAVLAKLAWLEAKLKLRHFAELRKLTDQARTQSRRPFVWLSSGSVAIRPGSREANMLASRGMGLPVSHLEI